MTCIFVFAMPPAFSQVVLCEDAFDLGQDFIFCGTSQEVTLTAQSPWEILNLDWELGPGVQLLDDSTANYTGTQSSFIIANVDLRSPNLIVNGDFSAGNTGFTSGMNHSPAFLILSGTYAVAPNPVPLNGGFAPCSDHTSGSGNMFIGNGSIFPNQNVWCQTIPVEPGATYDLSFWTASITAFSLSEMVFRIDGVNTGPVITPGPAFCEWLEGSVAWTAGMQNSVDVCIRNLRGANNGNDFVLDDISMIRECSTSDTVTITVQPISETWVDTILCPGESIVVGGMLYSADIQDTLVFIDQAGCDSIIYLSLLVLDPQLQASVSGPLTCLNNTVTLNATSPLGNIGLATYQWYGPDGLPLPGGNQAIVVVDIPGTYRVEWIYDTPQGSCLVETTVTVEDIRDIPVFDLGPDLFLICLNPTAIVDAATILGPGNWQFEWFQIMAGMETSLSSQASFLFDESGTFILEVLNVANGCMARDTLMVSVDLEGPQELMFEVTPPFCNPATGVAEIIDVLGGSFPYTIEILPSGSGMMVADGLFEGIQPGNYTWLVTDINGCTLVVPFTMPATIAPTFTLPSGLSGQGGIPLEVVPILSFPDSLVLSYSWQSEAFDLSCEDCSNVFVTGYNQGTLALCITTVGGCQLCELITLDFPFEGGMFIPTAFSPNEDGINDVFRPFFTPGYVREFNAFQIYDRWGGLIYEWRGGLDLAEIPFWDGKVNGRVIDSGVYVFVLEYERTDRSMILERGEIQLID